MSMFLHQQFLVKFFEGNDLPTLEKEINEHIRTMQLDNYVLKNTPQILMVDGKFILLATFEYLHLSMVVSKKHELQKLKILSDKNTQKLEKQINSTIKKMEKEKNFYLYQITPVEKHSNQFITTLVFRYCSSFMAQ